MASSLMDIKLKPKVSRVKQWVDDNLLKHPVFNRIYHEKYKSKDMIWMNVDEIQVKEKLDVLTRKFKGQFLMMDYLQDNKLQLALGSLSLPILLTGQFLKTNLQRMMTMRGAYQGFLLGYSKIALINAAAFGVANTYSKQQDYQYFDFMKRFMGVSLLLSPVYIGALKNLFQSYAPLDLSKSGQARAKKLMVATAVPYVFYQFLFGNSMYFYNKDRNLSGHLSLLLSCFTGLILTNATKVTLNQQIFSSSFALSLKTISAFMLLNMLVPQQLGKLLPRSYYRDQYYETLSEGVGYLTEKESNFVQICIVKNLFSLEYNDGLNNSSNFNQQEEINLFKTLQKEMNRHYQSPNEENYRFKVFEQNHKRVIELNSNEKNKDYHVEYDLNIFFDLTEEEFSNSYQLPGQFFDKKAFEPKSKLFELEDYHSDQIFDEEMKKEFLQFFMDEDQNDPVKIVLFWRQKKDLPKDIPKFQQIKEGDAFMQFTYFDIEKEEQSLAEYMSQFLLDFSQIQQQREDEEKQSEIQDQQKDEIDEIEQESSTSGRRLQYNFFSFPSNSQSFNNNRFTYNLNNNNFNNFSDLNFQTLEQQKKKKKKEKEPQIIKINEQYFKQRELLREPESHKNPFDKIMSTNYSYNVFNLPRTSTDTDIREDDYYKRKIKIDGIEIPAQVDWSSYGQFDKVKDQGDCNACYIFGANAGIEAHQSIKYGNHQTYSEQEVLDCSFKNQGCTGGQPFLVFDYIKNRGIHTNKNYPYIAQKKTCQERRVFGEKYRDLIKGYMFVKQGMKNLILAVNTGPIVVVKYASRDFRFYKKGVFFGQGCDELKDPNHSALLYGYNFNTEVPYLLFKNNWGPFWGDYGHYKVDIGDLEDDNYGKCLIANTPYNVMPIV